MPAVRVLVWDNDQLMDRISSPEDTFLIESIDASGSDDNVIRIGFLTASAIHLGHDDIHTFVSGVLSGNFITGTFYGDGANLDHVVNYLNGLDGSITLVAGPNITIASGPGEIVISASISGADFDEKVKVSPNDTTSDYLYNKLISGPNINIVEQDDGGDEKIVISSSLPISDDLSAVQLRRSEAFSILSASAIDVPFGITDIENRPSIVEHDDINIDRIVLKNSGLYLGYYDGGVYINGTRDIYAKVRLNDASDIASSYQQYDDISGVSDDYRPTFGKQFIFSASANDYVTLQAWKSSTGGTHELRDLVFGVVKLEGGVQGPPGPTGSTDFEVQHDDQAVVSYINVLNFEGGRVQVEDDGNRKATVKIPGTATAIGMEGRYGIEVVEVVSSSVPVGPDPVYQYFMNDSTSGSLATQVVDSAPNPLNLTVKNVSDMPVHTQHAQYGTGLSWDTVNQDAGPEVMLDGTKISSSLAGTTTASLGLVVDIDAITSYGSRLHSIGTGGNWGKFTLMTNDINELFFVTHETTRATWSVDLAGSGRTVYYVVYDSNQSTSNDRVKLYKNGTLQTPTSTSPPSQGQAVDVGTGQEFSLGKRGGDAGRSFQGEMYYADLYDVALSASDVLTLSNNLLSGTDADPRQATNTTVIVQQGRYFYAEDRNLSSNATANWQQKVRLSFDVEQTRRVRLGWNAQFGASAVHTRNEIKVELNDSDILDTLQRSMVYPLTTGSRENFAGFRTMVLSSGSHTLDLDFRSPDANQTMNLYQAHLEAEVIDDG